MDLTSRQRQLVFAITVVALAGLGFFLLRSGLPGHHPAKPPPPPHPAAAASSPVTPAAVPAPAGGSPAASSPVNIYRWLPFTEPQLARAAILTRLWASGSCR